MSDRFINLVLRKGEQIFSDEHAPVEEYIYLYCGYKYRAMYMFDELVAFELI